LQLPQAKIPRRNAQAVLNGVVRQERLALPQVELYIIDCRLNAWL
jgi:hypothetical protein